MAAVPILLKVLQTKSQHRIPIQLRWRKRPIARRAPSARRDNSLSPNRPAESSGRCTTTVAPKDPRTCPSKGRHELVIANIYALGIEKWCGSFPVTSGLLRVGLSPRAPVGHAARDRLEIPTTVPTRMASRPGPSVSLACRASRHRSRPSFS